MHQNFENLKQRIRENPRDIKAWREVALLVSTAEDFENVLFIINRLCLRNRLGIIFVTFCFSLLLTVPFTVFGEPPASSILYLVRFASVLNLLALPIVIVASLLSFHFFPSELVVCHDVIRANPTREVYETSVRYISLLKSGAKALVARESAFIFVSWIFLSGLGSDADKLTFFTFIAGTFACGIWLAIPMYIYFRLRGYIAGIFTKIPAKTKFRSKDAPPHFKVLASGEIIEIGHENHLLIGL